jgi:lysophospholipase L1-like esterase
MGERSGAIPSDRLLVTDGVHASAAGQVQILRTVIAGLADGAAASAQPPEI